MTTVIINIDIVGFHLYKNAPEKVSFLKNKHRHIFNIKAGFKVTNLDREKEIFIEGEEIENYLYESFGNPCQFEEMSCEMIASEILEFSKDNDCIWVEVLEDGKGGAKVEL